MTANFGVMFLMSESRSVALAAFAPHIFMIGVYTGPLYAMNQGLALPRMRAMAVAVHLFVVSILGGGIGPWIVGFALATQIIANYQPEVEAQHLYDNVAFAVLLVVLVRLYLREQPEEDLPPKIAEPSVG